MLKGEIRLQNTVFTDFSANTVRLGLLEINPLNHKRTENMYTPICVLLIFVFITFVSARIRFYFYCVKRPQQPHMVY